MRFIIFALLQLCSAISAHAAEPVQYVVDARIDPATGTLNATATIDLAENELQGGRLAFDLRSDLGRPEVLVRSGNRSSNLPVRHDRDESTGPDRTWSIVLPPGLQGSGKRITIRYSGRVTAGLNCRIGSDFVLVGGGTTAWYPQFGTRTAAGMVTVTLPSDFEPIMATPGRVVSRRGNLTTVRFMLPQAGEFSLAAGRFVQPMEAAEVIRLQPGSTRSAAALAERVPQIMRALTAQFGAFPFGQFRVLEIPVGAGSEALLLGGSFDGFMVMRSDYLAAKGADVGFLAHEIAHQWWGVAIRNAQGEGEYMLDEALANYAAMRTVEILEGPLAADSFRRGNAGLGGARDARNLIAAGFDAPLGALPVGPGYYALSDSKGYWAYHMTAQIVGQERFDDYLRDTAARTRREGTIRWNEFYAGLMELAEPGRRAAVAQLFESRGLTVIDHRWSQSQGRLDLVITQSGPPLPAKLPVQLAFADGTAQIEWIELAAPETRVELLTGKAVRTVVLDPLATLLWATPEEWSIALARAPVTRGKLAWDQGDTPAAKREFEAALEPASGIGAEPARFAAMVYLGWIAEEAGDLDQAERLHASALELGERETALVPTAIRNLARIRATRASVRPIGSPTPGGGPI